MKDKKKTQKLSILDRQLIPRLRFMGYLLICFSIISFAWGLFLVIGPTSETILDAEAASETSLFSNGKVDAFSIFGIFALVGALCIVIANKKQREKA